MREEGATNSQGISSEEWEAQHEEIDQWMVKLAEHLKMDRARLAQALLDWVVINGENDWLSEAAESDAAMGDYGHGDLSEFLRLATAAWREAWGSAGEHQPLDDVLVQIEDLIDDYRERK